MKFMRIFTEDHVDKAYPLSFDLMVDDQNRVAGENYAFGLLGKPEDDGDCYPFVLLADGSMDFGAADEEGRWWKTDLREKTIEVNGEFTAWEGLKETEGFEYRILKIIDLTEKG